MARRPLQQLVAICRLLSGHHNNDHSGTGSLLLWGHRRAVDNFMLRFGCGVCLCGAVYESGYAMVVVYCECDLWAVSVRRLFVPDNDSSRINDYATVVAVVKISIRKRQFVESNCL